MGLTVDPIPMFWLGNEALDSWEPALWTHPFSVSNGTKLKIVLYPGFDREMIVSSLAKIRKKRMQIYLGNEHAHN